MPMKSCLPEKTRNISLIFFSAIRGWLFFCTESPDSYRFVRQFAEHFRRIHRLDARRRQIHCPFVIEADGVFDGPCPLGEIIVIGAVRFEGTLFEHRFDPAGFVRRRALRAMNRVPGRCREWRFRPGSGQSLPSRSCRTGLRFRASRARYRPCSMPRALFVQRASWFF